MTTAISLAAKGYVRLPRPWIALPVSPAARLLLVHFCACADEDGASWYSYGQLADILNRSRAAIAGYVEELRRAGVIQTEAQRTANGFNYRLRVRLVGWRDIVTAWAAKTCRRAADTTRTKLTSATSSGSAPVEPAHPPSECRVQPSERKDPSGQNKIHQTDSPHSTVNAITPPPLAAEIRSSWTEKDETEWRASRPREDDPVGVFDRMPTDDLLRRAIQVSTWADNEAGFLEQTKLYASARTMLQRFIGKRRLQLPAEGLGEAARALAEGARTTRELDDRMRLVEREWKPYWRRLSSPAQIRKRLADARNPNPASSEKTTFALLFRRRAFIARIELKDREMRIRPALTSMRASCPLSEASPPPARQLDYAELLIPPQRELEPRPDLQSGSTLPE